MTAEALATWCAKVAAGFRGHEHHTQDPYRRDRDTALVEYAVRALGVRVDEQTEQVMERIDRVRGGTP